MRHTAVETDWHDNGKRFTIPAGEPVHVVPISAVPEEDQGPFAKQIKD